MTIHIKQLLGILGAATLFIGVFMPIISSPLTGSINYFRNGEGDGMFVIILAVLSMLLSLTKRYRLLWATGGTCAGMILYTFYEFRSRMTQIQADMELQLINNPFRGLADVAIQSVQLQWGLAVMLIGAALVIAAAAIKDTEEQIVEPATIPAASLKKQTVPPKKKNDWTERGKQHIKNGEYKEAVAALSYAITATPNNGDIYYMRAVAYSKLSDKDNALVDIKKATQFGNTKAINVMNKMMNK